MAGRTPGLVFVRLPAKEAQLVELLRAEPQTIAQLCAPGSYASRKIGRGYLRPMLRCLLDDGIIAVTNGVFWVRKAQS
jgi:hypothetical protein